MTPITQVLAFLLLLGTALTCFLLCFVRVSSQIVPHSPFASRCARLYSSRNDLTLGLTCGRKLAHRNPESEERDVWPVLDAM